MECCDEGFEHFCHTVLEDPLPACCDECTLEHFSDENMCIESECSVLLLLFCFFVLLLR